MDVSLDQIRKAEQRIRDFIYFSPCQLSAALSEVTGQQVFLKLDNLQRTGAFKERGALNKILLLSDEEKRTDDGNATARRGVKRCLWIGTVH